MCEVFTENEIMDKPEKIFNVDEKGCQLTLHKNPLVLAAKGSKRTHYRGKEHGENVSDVGCASAAGVMVPPMVLFKGIRK